MIAALRADSTISESVRNKAMDRARKRQMNVNAMLLCNRSNLVVRERELGADQYQLALRFAEAGCKLGKDDPNYGWFLHTLGVARYRVGNYAEAVETLSRSDQLLSKSDVASRSSNIAVLAMAHFRLGHGAEAHKLLEQLRQLIQTDDEWKANGASLRLVEEALQVISPAPVHAERPVKGRSAGAGAGGSQRSRRAADLQTFTDRCQSRLGGLAGKMQRVGLKV